MVTISYLGSEVGSFAFLVFGFGLGEEAGRGEVGERSNWSQTTYRLIKTPGIPPGIPPRLAPGTRTSSRLEPIEIGKNLRAGDPGGPARITRISILGALSCVGIWGVGIYSILNCGRVPRIIFLNN